MARDGLFFEQLARLHPTLPDAGVRRRHQLHLGRAARRHRHATRRLLTYVVFAGWIFYALGGIAMFYYRRAHRTPRVRSRCPAIRSRPSCSTLSAAAIVVNTMVTQPARAVIGLAILLAGTPAYFLWRKRAAIRHVRYTDRVLTNPLQRTADPGGPRPADP